MTRTFIAALFLMVATPAAALPQIPPPKVETRILATGLNHPWSLAFLPGGDLLITEKHGAVRRFRSGGLDPAPVAGGPVAYQAEDSGLLDIVLDPDFAARPFVYIAFAQGTQAANRTAVWKARWDGQALRDGRVIFRVSTDKRDPGHPGGRLLFLPDKTLLLTVGDGYDYADKAQDLGSHLGKVLRLDREGRPPPDNPFAGRAGVLPEIYSLGHRNPQGLVRDPRDGAIWLNEHGPMGGDEINALLPGHNYGWPRATFGLDYSGAEVTDLTAAPGMDAPRVVWVPSIAPSGFAVYRGAPFAAWEGDLFVGGLKNRRLMRVRLRPDGAARQEELLARLDVRIRDVRLGPDGLLYVLTDEANGRLIRLEPRPEAPGPVPAT